MINYCKVFSSWVLVCSLIAVLLEWIIVDGIEQGQRNGAIYPDNSPPIGPHHWNPFLVAELTIKYFQTSIYCAPVQVAPEFPWREWCYDNI